MHFQFSIIYESVLLIFIIKLSDPKVNLLFIRFYTCSGKMETNFAQFHYLPGLSNRVFEVFSWLEETDRRADVATSPFDPYFYAVRTFDNPNISFGVGIKIHPNPNNSAFCLICTLKSCIKISLKYYVHVYSKLMDFYTAS